MENLPAEEADQDQQQLNENANPQPSVAESVVEEKPISWRHYFTIIGTRTLIVTFAIIFGFCLPNLNLMLIFSGAVFGTLIVVIFPVLFYNRAYSRPPEYYY